MKRVGPLFRYQCTNPAHQHAAKAPSDTMTIHEHAWAYCPSDVRAGEHAWSLANGSAPMLLPTERVDLPTLD